MSETVPPYAAELLAATERGTAALRQIDAAASARRPAPGKWCAREIVGHLIDSATVNHQRFARAQRADDLVFPGYEPDAWVAGACYQDAPWDELVTLWAALNRHLARVMLAIPSAVRRRERRRHNLHEIAWRPVPADRPASLDTLMEDYVGHLVHHLRQILGPAWQAGTGPADTDGPET